MEKNNIIVLTNKKLKKYCSIFKSKDELLRFFDGWLKCNDLDQNVRLKDLHEKVIYSESTVLRQAREHKVIVCNLEEAINILIEDYGYDEPQAIQEELNKVVKRIRIAKTFEEEAKKFGLTEKYIQDNSFKIVKHFSPEQKKGGQLIFWNDRLKKT